MMQRVTMALMQPALMTETMKDGCFESNMIASHKHNTSTALIAWMESDDTRSVSYAGVTSHWSLTFNS